MEKINKYLKRSYVLIIIALLYIPLLFAAIFSFNTDAKKGNMSFNAFNHFSSEGWKELYTGTVGDSLVNSLLIAIPAAFIVLVIGILTTYSLWNQRSRIPKTTVDGISSIPLINPDIITAIGLSLAFSTMFGVLQFGDSGYIQTVFAHVVMILPFVLTIMYPQSEKFNATLLEASKDLGFGPIASFFKTYFVHMIPVTIASLIVALVLSFDDFIITRIIFHGDTIGTQLYQGSVKAWTLAAGTSMLIFLFGLTGLFGLYRLLQKKLKGRVIRHG